ncbi:MAG: DEAD/DEAH box helicase [Alphaproteobacteria bacterium]
MLPLPFEQWFARRGWTARAHQLALVDHAARGQSVLLVAPTGGGKTLAGFLPTLIDLANKPKRARKRGLHTLYISPLKALAVDVARNLDAPITEMDLPVTVDPHRRYLAGAARRRQRHSPPDILLTTPEQLSCCWPPSPPAAPRCSRICAPWCWMNCTRSTIPSAAICWRWGWRGFGHWRPPIGVSACRPR